MVMFFVQLGFYVLMLRVVCLKPKKCVCLHLLLLFGKKNILEP